METQHCQETKANNLNSVTVKQQVQAPCAQFLSQCVWWCVHIWIQTDVRWRRETGGGGRWVIKSLNHTDWFGNVLVTPGLLGLLLLSCVFAQAGYTPGFGSGHCWSVWLHLSELVVKRPAQFLSHCVSASKSGTLDKLVFGWGSRLMVRSRKFQSENFYPEAPAGSSCSDDFYSENPNKFSH